MPHSTLPLSARPAPALLRAAPAPNGCSCGLSYSSRQAVIYEWGGAAPNCEINGLIPVTLCCAHWGVGALCPCPPAPRSLDLSLRSSSCVPAHVAAVSRLPGAGAPLPFSRPLQGILQPGLPALRWEAGRDPGEG